MDVEVYDKRDSKWMNLKVAPRREKRQEIVKIIVVTTLVLFIGLRARALTTRLNSLLRGVRSQVILECTWGFGGFYCTSVGGGTYLWSVGHNLSMYHTYVEWWGNGGEGIYIWRAQKSNIHKCDVMFKQNKKYHLAWKPVVHSKLACTCATNHFVVVYIFCVHLSSSYIIVIFFL